MAALQFKANTPFSFLPEGLGSFELCRFDLEGEEGAWSACRMLVKTDAETLEQLERQARFHNNPSFRLDAVQGGFRQDLPVFLELQLLPEKLGLLPVGRPDGPCGELLKEDAWNLLAVWQEHHLDPSIGGGSIKVGYRTVFSPPRNEIDRLRRQGPVSFAIVEALLESGLPVRYETGRQAFECGLKVETQSYIAHLYPHDEACALTLDLRWPEQVAEEAKARVKELLGRINHEIVLGEFLLEQGEIAYLHTMQVEKALICPTWVVETLRAGISQFHHIMPLILRTLAERP